ncbi:MAG: TIGR02285 family protein [Gammaproteobacteria bacterium]|nr:TIGR02285 family protein [Gammaproteobacteria bacterium]MBU1556023.1 TIGR02285 family protein [Gammaproteobacteria bacterium]MBU2070877.1 TIGR02285 family protein [Gammaproteobacteria bacterium]MBU2185030.1 TIGR02285 family protein [Gammaproteobacteria bacterium]MBU2204083.1 TIGR02285 family protein [Gammaproteobacteria bacterium]
MLFRCVLLLLMSSASATPQLTWLQTDWPPHQIVSGPFQGQGTFDLLQQQLTAAMPQFQHRNKLVNLARLEQAFVQQEPALCTLGTLYSEQRAQSRLFSLPMAVGPALAVGYLAGKLDTHPAMQANGVDMQKLALDKKLRGAYQPNRLYPDSVKSLFGHPQTNLTSHTFTSEVNATALLAGNRVDYVVEYPERMQYYNQLLPQATTLEHRAIIGANTASVSYISCSKDETGRAAISALNQLLPLMWQQAEYQQAMQRWLDDSARQRLSTEMALLQQQVLMQLKPRPHNTVDAGH